MLLSSGLKSEKIILIKFILNITFSVGRENEIFLERFVIGNSTGLMRVGIFVSEEVFLDICGLFCSFLSLHPTEQ